MFAMAKPMYESASCVIQSRTQIYSLHTQASWREDEPYKLYIRRCHAHWDRDAGGMGTLLVPAMVDVKGYDRKRPDERTEEFPRWVDLLARLLHFTRHPGAIDHVFRTTDPWTPW
jgi:hypothetical protein